jgi:hypothetical protein
VDVAIRRTRACAAGTLLLALLLGSALHAGEAPAATIEVSSATAGSSLGGRLVEGVMKFRGNEYLLTLRGVAKSVSSVGSVPALVRARDIEGVFEPADGALRNANGVTVSFDPPLELEQGKLEIEVSHRRSPKVSGGHRESGVE